MKTMKLSEASRSLAEYASELDEDIVLVTGRNRPIAAVVSLKNVDREVLSLSRNPQFLVTTQVPKEGLEIVRAGGGISKQRLEQPQKCARGARKDGTIMRRVLQLVPFALFAPFRGQQKGGT